MQEEVTGKSVALIVDGARMSEQVLEKAVQAYLDAQKNKQPKSYRGKQSLTHRYGGTKPVVIILHHIVHTNSTQDLINLTENLDCYDVYSDIDPETGAFPDPASEFGSRQTFHPTGRSLSE